MPKSSCLSTRRTGFSHIRTTCCNATVSWYMMPWVSRLSALRITLCASCQSVHPVPKHRTQANHSACNKRREECIWHGIFIFLRNSKPAFLCNLWIVVHREMSRRVVCHPPCTPRPISGGWFGTNYFGAQDKAEREWVVVPQNNTIVKISSADTLSGVFRESPAGSQQGSQQGSQ